MKVTQPFTLFALLVSLASLALFSACGSAEQEDIDIPIPVAETPITAPAAPESDPAVPTSVSNPTPAADTSATAAPAASILFPHTTDGVLFGYVDVTGQFVIEPQFSQAFPFVEGVAAVMLDDKFGFIDPAGQFVIEPQFDVANSFSEGLAAISLPDDPERDLFGFIDPTGQIVIEPQFDFPTVFSDGRAVVSRGAADDFKLGAIDSTGQFVIQPQYDYLSQFAEGLAVFGAGERLGYLDTNGQVVIEPQFDFAGPFAEGLAVIRVEDQYGFIDPTGQVVIEPQFDFASDFVEERAVVNVDGQDGYIDPTGQIVIAPQFDRADLFSEGLAAVERDGLTGYIDPTGQVVIEPQFLTGGLFQAGVAQVTQADLLLFIDRSGQTLAELANPFATAEAAVIDPAATIESSTLIFDFIPLLPTERRTGSCFTNSLAVPQPSAWRCTVADQIFDPCLTAEDGQTIVCDADPTRSPGFALDLAEPLPEPDLSAAETQPTLPWLFEVSGGAICVFNTGATATVGDQRVNYLCSDESQILGELQPGDPWTAEKVLLESGDNGSTVSESVPLEVTAMWRVVSPAALLAEIGLDPTQVQLSTPAVNRVQGYFRPTLPYAPDVPPAYNGIPAHLRFSFDDDTLSPWFDPVFERQLLIFPVAAYRQMYEAAGVPDIGQRIDALAGLIAARPEAVSDPIPVFPPLGDTVQDLQAQVSYLDFAGGSGVRFITHFAPEASPITNDAIFYTFQGLTADGRFYLAFYQPISTSALPDTFDESPAAADYDTFAANFENYLAETRQTLNDLPATAFEPDLAQLDALIESLQLGN